MRQKGAIWIYVVFLVIFPALLIALSHTVKTDGQHWDLSLPWSINEFHTQNALRFASDVETATQGRVSITVHPGATLGIKGPDSLRATSDGVVPLVEMAGFQQTGVEPLLGLESLPFLIETQDDLRILYQVLRPTLERAFARHGVKLLYIVPWPNQNLYTKSPVNNLQDLAGLKMRTYDANTTRLSARLGLIPIQMPAPDVVPALASGAVDATMTSTTTAAAQKYWEFLRYIHRTSHIWVSNMLVVNQAAWDTLSPKDQEAILDTAQRLEPEFWAIAKADDEKQLKVLLQNGMKIGGPGPEMLADMRALARPMWREFIEDVPEAEPILNAYLEATGRDAL